MSHNPKCTGCPHCNEEMASLITMSPSEYQRWLTTAQHRGMRTSLERRATRATVAEPVRKTDAEWTEHFDVLLEEEAPPPPFDYNDAVRLAHGAELRRVARVGLADNGVPLPPDYLAAVRAQAARRRW